jgi:NitT/TauT family transport system ATP-binding protein
MALSETASVVPPGLGASERDPPLVRLEGVSKTFAGRTAVQALDRVTLDVRDHEFVVLVGPSGCGKTTLLHLVAGLLSTSEGHIERAPEVARPGGIGMVFQGPVLMPWRSVVDNVLLPGELLGLSRQATFQKAVDLLSLVGLAGFETALPHQLSGGMQQRASLCRALLTDPPLLLMDEPFGALDAITREGLNSELQRIWLEDRKTVLFVTHSITEALFLSDRVVVLDARPGRVAGIVQNRLPRPRTAHTFKAPEFAEYSIRIRAMIGGVTDEGVPSGVLQH